jgi:PleD family two-component response regulator
MNEANGTDETDVPWKARQPLVLLIDDQAMVGEAVRRMLAECADVAFHACHEPAKALSQTLALQPTAILLDLVMPDIDGFTLLKFLKGNAKTGAIPVIVMSSKDDAAIKAEAFAKGASDYLVKMPEKAELQARVRLHSKHRIALLQRDEALAAWRMAKTK